MKVSKLIVRGKKFVNLMKPLISVSISRTLGWRVEFINKYLENLNFIDCVRTRGNNYFSNVINFTILAYESHTNTYTSQKAR
jgi:hypothetical protein